MTYRDAHFVTIFFFRSISGIFASNDKIGTYSVRQYTPIGNQNCTVANKSKLKVSIIQRIDRKVALDEIAMTNGLEFNELLDEIEAIVYSGTRINIDYFLNDVMDEDHIDDIYEYFKDSETDDLEDAIEELGGDYTEEEIRLVRIKFLSEMAN